MLHHRFTEVQNNIRKLAFPSNLSTQTSAVPVWIEAVYGRRAFFRMLLHHVFYSRPEWTKQTKIRANPCYHHSRPPNPTCWTLWTGKLVSLIHFVVLHFCVVMDCGLILARKLLWHIYHIYPQNNNNKKTISQVFCPLFEYKMQPEDFMSHYFPSLWFIFFIMKVKWEHAQFQVIT